MTPDHKTVREALRLAEKKCFDATGRIDLELSLSITQALAALDRIEATQPPTEEMVDFKPVQLSIKQPPTDAQRQEEKTCTCGAAGSGEGHTDWCDWLDVESPAVQQQQPTDAQKQAAFSDVVKYLLGEAPLRGHWFGEKHPPEGKPYWWRKHLREATLQSPAVPNSDMDIQLMDYASRALLGGKEGK